VRRSSIPIVRKEDAAATIVVFGKEEVKLSFVGHLRHISFRLSAAASWLAAPHYSELNDIRLGRQGRLERRHD
jgi:hypothetical protein